ncbi:hypothetical protein [Domibacillus sp. 8LH]
MFTGIIPTLFCLILSVNALIKISRKSGLTALPVKQRKILFCDKQ